MGNVMKSASILIFTAIFLAGCSSGHSNEPGSINNVDVKQSSSASLQPSGTPSPVSTDNEVVKVDTTKAVTRLNECLGRLTDVTALKQISAECFFSYPQELPTLYKMRSVGEIFAKESDKSDDGRITVKVSSKYGDLGEVSFYYIESMNQLKVVSSTESGVLAQYGSQTVKEQAFSEAGL